MDPRIAENSTVMEEDLYYALNYVDLQRVHITLTIDDFECITEDRRYIFYNKGTQKVSILPLPARERKTQRNMKVEDSSNRNLVFIPSSSSTDIFVRACTTIFEKSNEYLNEPQKNAFEKIRANIQPNLKEVFEYKPNPENIKSVHEHVGDILETDIFKKSEEFIKLIFPLVEILKQYNNGLYYPLVALSEPFQPHNYTLVKLSVEKLREYLKYKRERFKTLAIFGLLGKFTFSFKPELHPGISNHVRIYAPDGLVIRDVEFDLSKKRAKEKKNRSYELEKELNEKKKDNFDEKCFYVQLGPEESKIMYDCKTYLNITFGLNKKGFHLGLLPLLSLFLWLTIISPVFFNVLQSPQLILMLLALSVTILVAIGIYAIDKKIVNHYIITQVVLAFTVFVAEIFYMILS